MNDLHVNWRELIIDAAKEGQTMRWEEIMIGSDISTMLNNTLQSGRNARLKYFVHRVYISEQLAAYSQAGSFLIDCDVLAKDQIDSIVADLINCGHRVEILQKMSMLLDGKDVENKFTCLRIDTFPKHVQESVAEIWKKRIEKIDAKDVENADAQSTAAENCESVE
jgi:hypothetical protein